MNTRERLRILVNAEDRVTIRKENRRYHDRDTKKEHEIGQDFIWVVLASV